MRKYWLWLAIFGTAAVLFAACVWKYGLFLYNGIDLAYFNQVFWNTVHGRPFTQSIHPHLSLGDHAEIAILALAPLYALWQDPRMLLALQAIAVTLPAWPLWHLAQRRGLPRTAAAVIALAWLLNPSVHNIALFEFHVLPFAMFPLCMATLAYEDGHHRRFIAWLLAALVVREDVALVVPFFGLLAWLEDKPRWWRIAPIALGAAWFVAAMRLIAHFSPAGSYKFGIYYAWLGDALTQPWQLVQHLVTLPNAEMLLGFLLPLAFLPLLRPVRLLLLTAPLAQILLGAPGGGEIVLQTHYATLFLPALFLAAIDGLAAAPAALKRLPAEDMRVAAPALLVLCAAYGAITLGPLPSVTWRAFTAPDALRADAAAARAAVASIPKDAAVVSSYDLLPALSSRQRLESLHYWYLGTEQFATGPYSPSPDITHVAVDARDFLVYQAQFEVTTWAQPYRADGVRRVEKEISDPLFARPPYFVYSRGAGGTLEEPLRAVGVHSPDELLLPSRYRFVLDGIRSAILVPRSSR